MRGIQCKTAIVTGARSGIGQAIALRLTSEGAASLITGRSISVSGGLTMHG